MAFTPVRTALVAPEDCFAGVEEPASIDLVVLMHGNGCAVAAVEWAEPDIVCRDDAEFERETGVYPLAAYLGDDFANAIRTPRQGDGVFHLVEADRPRTGKDFMTPARARRIRHQAREQSMSRLEQDRQRGQNLVDGRKDVRLSPDSFAAPAHEFRAARRGCRLVGLVERLAHRHIGKGKPEEL